MFTSIFGGDKVEGAAASTNSGKRLPLKFLEGPQVAAAPSQQLSGQATIPVVFAAAGTSSHVSSNISSPHTSS